MQAFKDDTQHYTRLRVLPLFLHTHQATTHYMDPETLKNLLLGIGDPNNLLQT